MFVPPPLYGASNNFLYAESCYLSICKHIQASCSFEKNQRRCPSSSKYPSNHHHCPPERKSGLSLSFVFLPFCSATRPLPSELGPQIPIQIDTALVTNDLHTDTPQPLSSQNHGTRLIIATIIEPSRQSNVRPFICYFWKLTFHHVPFPPDSLI